MENKYLLVQDDCALDSLQTFQQEMLDKYNLYFDEFKEKGLPIEDGYMYKGFILQFFPDNPYWHLKQRPWKLSSEIRRELTYSILFSGFPIHDTLVSAGKVFERHGICEEEKDRYFAAVKTMIYELHKS